MLSDAISDYLAGPQDLIELKSSVEHYKSSNDLFQYDDRFFVLVERAICGIELNKESPGSETILKDVLNTLDNPMSTEYTIKALFDKYNLD